MNQSRTSNSIKNARVALIFYFIGLSLNFISRKVFIDHLGNDIIGLNTIIVNLLSFLNLAELGIGAAISYSLYKPLHDNNKQDIQDIITVQGYFYRKIAYVLIGSSCVLMLFFPLIFKKSDLPLWYAYSTFSVLLLSSLMSYIWNYKQILLTADQKQYKITINQQVLNYAKVLLQMLAVVYIERYAYIAWLFIEFLFSVLMTFSLSVLIKKEFRWLVISINNGKYLLYKYSSIVKKIKQLFFHKISGFVLLQTSPIIIYIYASLDLVVVYGNYLLIITGLTSFLNAMFNSMSAVVGNLVAQADKDRIVSVFWELFAFRFGIVSVFAISVYYLSAPFIIIWLGSSYVIDKITLVLIVGIFFITSLRVVVDSFIQAYGMFKDVWATTFEAILNLSLSVSLGYFMGINGVLLGVLISLFFMVNLWKPFFLFREGFDIKVKIYFLKYIKYLLCLLLLVVVNTFAFNYSTMAISFLDFFVLSIKVFLFNLTFLFLIMFACFKEMRCLINRLIAHIKLYLKI